MKKVLVKVIFLMLISMVVVLGISRLTIFLLSLDNELSPNSTYIISLVSGFLGLIVFLILLQVFIFKRINKVSNAVNVISKGNFDVTIEDKNKDEISKLSNDINTMAKELKNNEYLNKEFINNVSHEFKTPVSSLIGFSDLLLEDNNLSNDEKKEYSKIINDEAKKLYNMSMNMLKISSLDSSTIIPLEDNFIPAKSIRRILLLHQNKWTHKKINMDLDLEETLIKHNEELLDIVFQNLITNAIKFCNTNGEVKIKLHIIDNILKFEISNTGKKIEEDDKIFDLFFLSASEENKEGSGLGLPLVRKIVTKLNGNIEYISDDRLTSFYFELPL